MKTLEMINVGCNVAPNPKFPQFDVKWTRMDVDPEVKPDIVHNVMDPMPEELLGKFDGLFTSHMLEHIPWHTVIWVLDNMTKVIKPDGYLFIIVPDLEWACHQLIRGINDPSVVAVMYGGEMNEWDYHKCGFTEAGLRLALQRVGFRVMELKHQTFRATIMEQDYRPYELNVSAVRGNP